MELEQLVKGARLVADIPGAGYARNLVKLAEETGELARTLHHPVGREAVIEEVADVVITAVVQGMFVDMTAAELEEALHRKLPRALLQYDAAGTA